ncbi:glutamine synthetase family protein [Albimonas sp. CAU 1670]|uniref:glutamine synthetase family protein n=1 Tax=Albimonas sp. CAU 1670 TaxID=3032599 RepID=UPI0023DB5077|nr:glutamine synthetase family protein [Albimonas sp. CAU 1670]MDF2233914.1 glutamine synthetase family protein [Albimonas sp. CAU 1670]
MPGKLTLEELRAAVEDGEIDTVLAVQPDMQGRLMGKRFQAEFFLEGAVEETHSCNYLQATDMEMETVAGYAATSWEKGYGDYVMKPDLGTLRRIPWLEGTALVVCDVLDHHHHPVPHAPRNVLRAQAERLAAKGWSANVATELEFFLFKESYEAAQAKDHLGLSPVSAYNEDYHIFQTTKEEDVMRAIRTGMNAADIPIENSKGEADAGQEEINVRYAEALTMADRHVILKNGIKEIAWAKGKSVSFMAKWSYDHAGSSSHVHMSLAGPEGEPLFHDPDAEYGMSELMRSFLAGQLAHAAEITLFLAPYINSYKRFVAGTFAPTKICWSMDNRTAGFRVVGEGTRAVRLECRIGGADLNPYMAIAAMIAAGLDGVEKGLTLPPEHRGDAYLAQKIPEIPGTLREAMAIVDGSSFLRGAFGDEVVDHYVHAARIEQMEMDRRVTDWELRRGFERA